MFPLQELVEFEALVVLQMAVLSVRYLASLSYSVVLAST